MHQWISTSFLVLGLLSLPFGQQTQTDAVQHPANDVPKIIFLGFDQYKANGPDAAVKTWIQAGPLDGSKDALSQAGVLRQAQNDYGPYKAFELISSRNISPSTRIFYITIEYDKGPLFAKFVIYRTDQGWVLTSFTFNADEDKILPDC